MCPDTDGPHAMAADWTVGAWVHLRTTVRPKTPCAAAVLSRDNDITTDSTLSKSTTLSCMHPEHMSVPAESKSSPKKRHTAQDKKVTLLTAMTVRKRRIEVVIT